MEINEKKLPAKKAKKGQLNAEKELARLYFLAGETQKAIAERIDVSAVTVNKWVRDGGWDSLRAAKSISRRELVAKMLAQINERLESRDWSADEMIKATAAIEKLDKQTNVVTVIEVFTAYNKWLVGRMQIDPDLTPELVKVMNKYQDLFISEELNAHQVEFR